jgi:hypothetical protein
VEQQRGLKGGIEKGQYIGNFKKISSQFLDAKGNLLYSNNVPFHKSKSNSRCPSPHFWQLMLFESMAKMFYELGVEKVLQAIWRWFSSTGLRCSFCTKVK